MKVEPIPQVLVDGWPDGCVEERAWVEVTKQTNTKNKAAEYLAQGFPREDGEGDYRAADDTVFQRPSGMKIDGGHYIYDAPPLPKECCIECEGSGADYDDPGAKCQYCYGTGSDGTVHEDGDGPWEPCAAGDEDCREFWLIEVVGT